MEFPNPCHLSLFLSFFSAKLLWCIARCLRHFLWASGWGKVSCCRQWAARWSLCWRWKLSNEYRSVVASVTLKSFTELVTKLIAFFSSKLFHWKPHNGFATGRRSQSPPHVFVHERSATQRSSSMVIFLAARMYSRGWGSRMKEVT